MLESHLNLGSGGIAVEEPEQGREQTEIVQHGWPKTQRQIAHVQSQLADELLRLAQILAGLRPVQTAARLQGKLQTGQELADLVVELASEVATFLLLDFEQAT